MTKAIYLYNLMNLQTIKKDYQIFLLISNFLETKQDKVKTHLKIKIISIQNLKIQMNKMIAKMMKV